MKKLTIKRIALRAILPLSIFASCDYLDVVPPEQPETKDTMTDATDAVNFTDRSICIPLHPLSD